VARLRHGLEQIQRVRDERVLEALDDELRRRLELEPVGEVDVLHDRGDLVESVLAARADDECQVELRVGLD
jgi:hypothetical protein